MTSTAEDVEPTPSCSHHGSSRDVEIVVLQPGVATAAAGDDAGATASPKPRNKDTSVDGDGATSGDSSDDDDEDHVTSERVQLKPLPSSRQYPIIELENREVVFAIAVFLLVGTSLGMVLFICTWKVVDEVRFGAVRLLAEHSQPQWPEKRWRLTRLSVFSGQTF